VEEKLKHNFDTIWNYYSLARFELFILHTNDLTKQAATHKNLDLFDCLRDKAAHHHHALFYCKTIL